MIPVSISGELLSKCPDMALGIIECNLVNDLHNEELWKEIAQEIEKIRTAYTLETVKLQPNIAATREVYKACGKEPNRYRPSAEALYRRVIKERDLYKISTLVDLVNLISLRTGYSIGGFDADKIKGSISFGIGKEGEPYHGIGRGLLNIANMPVLRDETGGIGTPTSDEERTAIRLETTHFLMTINGYTGKDFLPDILENTIRLLTRYTAAAEISTIIVED